MTVKSKYPTLDKIKEVSKDSQKLGEFLGWLSERGISLCDFSKYPMLDSGKFLPISKNTEEILAMYYNIDLEQAEKERRMILEELRKPLKEDKK